MLAPTLLPEIAMGELVTDEVPLKAGTVPEVPLPVAVCAAAPADVNTKNVMRCGKLGLLERRIHSP